MCVCYVCFVYLFHFFPLVRSIDLDNLDWLSIPIDRFHIHMLMYNLYINVCLCMNMNTMEGSFL